MIARRVLALLVVDFPAAGGVFDIGYKLADLFHIHMSVIFLWDRI